MYVFVYGSLKKEFENSFYMDYSEYIGEAITAKPEFQMYSVHERFPALTNGNEYIKGELYKISNEDLYHLDRLEGYPNFYNRKEFEVKCDNKIYNALIYYLDDNKNNQDYINSILNTESKRISRYSNTAEWLKR